MRKQTLDKLGSLLLFSAIFISCGTTAMAQAIYGTIVGNAHDAGGAVLPNIAVTITNEASGEAHTVTTSGSGDYIVQNLIPGVYHVTSAAQGFRSVDVQHIRLEAVQVSRIDLTFAVGNTNESVVVTSDSPVVETDTSEISQEISTREVTDLPLNGRNFLQLATLTNGVNAAAGTESGGPNITVDGNRVTQNSFLINGIETRIQREGGYGINLSIDAIQEFKLLVSAYPAEYGRGTAIVNTVIKAGTNQFHGTVFEFFRNNYLNAPYDFQQPALPQSGLRQNNFGGSFGGPVFRDKLFFFTNYEGFRQTNGGEQFTDVPNPAVFTGNLGANTPQAYDPVSHLPFPGNVIPTPRISQFAKAASAYFPAPLPVVTAQGTNFNYYQNIKNTVITNQGTGRVDYVIGAKDRVSGNYTNFQYDIRNPGLLPYTGSLSVDHSYDVSGDWIRTISPHAVNTFRFGFNHSDTFFGPDQTADHNINLDLGIKNITPDPAAYALAQIYFYPLYDSTLNPGANTQYGYPGEGTFRPNGATDINRQVLEQFAYLRGKNSFKFGADLRFYKYNDLGYATQNGSYLFPGYYSYDSTKAYGGTNVGNPLADFLLGIPYQVNIDQLGGKTFQSVTSNGEHSGYAQDDVRVLKNLTLNLGLRYEYVQYPKEANNQYASWNFQKGALDYACQGLPCRGAPDFKTGFAPRLGFAYSPLSWNNKLTVRGGFGIAYSNFRQYEYAILHFAPPFVFSRQFTNGFPVPSQTTATLFPAVTPGDLSKIDYTQLAVPYQNQNKTVPRMFQYNFGIQQQIAQHLLFELTYVGNIAHSLPARYDPNQATLQVVPGLSGYTDPQTRRPYKNVGFLYGNESSGYSNYNALNVKVQRHYVSGLDVVGTYTFSKALGTTGTNNFTVLDINNFKLNYGPFNGDFTNDANISFVYELPFGNGKTYLSGLGPLTNAVLGGWQVNGIVSFLSGAALTVTTSTSANVGNNTNANHPNQVKDNPNSVPGGKTDKQYFDTSAFQDVAFGRIGNAREGEIRGPGGRYADLSVFKNNKVGEHLTTQLRLEGFNAFNHIIRNGPDTALSTPVSSTYGRITSAQGPRVVQIALKLIF